MNHDKAELIEHYRRMLKDLESGNRKAARQTITVIFAEQQMAMARKM